MRKTRLSAIALVTVAALALVGCKTAEQEAAEAAAARAAKRAEIEKMANDGVTSPLLKTASRFGVRKSINDRLSGSSLNSTDELDRVAEMSVQFNPQQLADGWLAFAALHAAENPEFRDGVLDTAMHYGRDQTIANLSGAKTWAATLPGAASAQGSVLSAASRERAKLNGISNRYKTFSYDLQDQAWAKGRISNSGARASGLKAKASITRAADSNVMAQTQQYAASQVSSSRAYASLGSSSTGRASTRVGGGLMDQVLTLAALEVLGANDEIATSTHRQLVSNTAGKHCMSSVQLNMYQCVAAARFQYEEPFCVSEHALKEMGECLGALR